MTWSQIRAGARTIEQPFEWCLRKRIALIAAADVVRADEPALFDSAGPRGGHDVTRLCAPLCSRVRPGLCEPTEFVGGVGPI